MDKAVLGFIADLLYIKGIITIREYNDIQDSVTPVDLGHIIERMLRGEYDGEKLQGEGYVTTVQIAD